MSAVGLAITVAILGVRNGGLKADAKESEVDAREADSLRKTAETSLKVTSREFDEYRIRAEAIEEELSEELDRYENQEIAAIRDEPDQAVRVKRRRRMVGSVLSQAFTPTSDDSESGVPEESSS